MNPPLPDPDPPPAPATEHPGWAHRVRSHLKRSWRSHLSTLAVALAAMVAVQAWQTRDAPRGVAPAFSALLVANGAAPAMLAADGHIGLDEWRAAHPGRAVAVHIWSDWCPFCRAEENSVTAVAADWPVLTVASRSGDAAQVTRWMAQRGLNWATAIDPAGQVARTYGLAVVPAWVVVAPDGHISSVATGYTTELGMRARLWWAQGW